LGDWTKMHSKGLPSVTPENRKKIEKELSMFKACGKLPRSFYEGTDLPADRIAVIYEQIQRINQQDRRRRAFQNGRGRITTNIGRDLSNNKSIPEAFRTRRTYRSETGDLPSLDDMVPFDHPLHSRYGGHIVNVNHKDHVQDERKVREIFDDDEAILDKVLANKLNLEDTDSDSETITLADHQSNIETSKLQLKKIVPPVINPPHKAKPMRDILDEEEELIKLRQEAALREQELKPILEPGSDLINFKPFNPMDYQDTKL